MNDQSVGDAFSRDIYTVSRLNSEVRAVLEGSFPLLWVEGEISNLARPASGHVYFSLKDAHAQVRCALFRMRRQRLRFQPADGQRVLMRARISLYEGRGEYQLIVEHMEPAGEGALRQAFEQLKQRLADEGLFDSGHKSPLPSWPRRIGVITSPTGAAIRDVLSVLARRFPVIPVVVYPVPVQGAEAPAAIADMIRLANHRNECDLLILTRGGGSLEDLAAFNDEGVARAIHESRLPIVSAIGHEVDFSIADFVADRRAPTPSAAAELVSPDRDEVRQTLEQGRRRLRRQMDQRLALLATRLGHLADRLQRLHPGNRLLQQAQRLDELEQRLGQTMTRLLRHRQQRLELLATRLRARSPALRIGQAGSHCGQLRQRLDRAITGLLQANRQRLAAHAGSLQALSPLATLERGYSITRRLVDGRVVTAAGMVSAGDRVETLLARGRLVCRVEEQTAGGEH